MTTPIKPDLAPYVDSATETTVLPPKMERKFRAWVSANAIADAHSPDAKYDYRGFWLKHGDVPVKFGVDHFPDTFKQHGHPTFSMESQYSKGVGDGGVWAGDKFIPEEHIRLMLQLLQVPNLPGMLPR